MISYIPHSQTTSHKLNALVSEDGLQADAYLVHCVQSHDQDQILGIQSGWHQGIYQVVRQLYLVSNKVALIARAHLQQSGCTTPRNYICRSLTDVPLTSLVAQPLIPLSLIPIPYPYAGELHMYNKAMYNHYIGVFRVDIGSLMPSPAFH